jgi:ABC-2 type transport system ATP-binding protein
MTPVISTSGLVKTFGRTRALDGLDIEVRAAGAFAFGHRDVNP